MALTMGLSLAGCVQGLFLFARKIIMYSVRLGDNSARIYDCIRWLREPFGSDAFNPIGSDAVAPASPNYRQSKANIMRPVSNSGCFTCSWA